VLLFQVTEFGPDGAVLPLDDQNDVLRFVNGQLRPVIRMRPGETQRWRIGNINADYFFNFELEGHQLHQIAKDANPNAEVWSRDVILLEPAARVEVLVQAGEPGTYALKNVPWPEGYHIPEETLATLIVEGEPMEPQPLPTTLIPFEDLTQLEVDHRREIEFQIIEEGGNDVFMISGEQFNENVVNQTAKLGALEEWTIKNSSDRWHPFHIHINDYQVTHVNGEPVQAHSYEDTTGVPSNGSITMRTRYADFVGKWVYHCHILAHEDLGMMGIIEVVE
jgi:FtsP/CotA-like multicopper oxidase with cupredoxin domain